MNCEEQDRRANDIIFQTAGAMAAVGATNPIPLADAPMLIGGWATMLVRLGNCYDIAFDAEGFKTLMQQMPKSVAFYVFGVGAFLTVIQWTGIGTIPAGIANGALNAGFTLSLGKLYAESFKSGNPPTSGQVYKALKNTKPKS